MLHGMGSHPSSGSSRVVILGSGISAIGRLCVDHEMGSICDRLVEISQARCPVLVVSLSTCSPETEIDSLRLSLQTGFFFILLFFLV